jgi:NAD(P)-dependent dehydrogenase (short-subunit alcohol dehydrogenase family)
MSHASSRIALVTGGAHGIGAAISARLAQDGCGVVIADRDAPAHLPLGARSLLCDVSDEASVNRLIDGVRAQEGRLDILVCNAGITIHKAIATLSLAEWSRVIGTNLTATFLLVRAAESLLRAAKGAVVTIASTRARMSEPNTEAYAASKGGLVALTHALSISLAPDVRVNCISPGWIYTKGDRPRPEDHAFHPVGRVGVADDVAALTAFLVGPESGFITGAEFTVDGGVTRKMIYPD